MNGLLHVRSRKGQSEPQINAETHAHLRIEIANISSALETQEIQFQNQTAIPKILSIATPARTDWQQKQEEQGLRALPEHQQASAALRI